MRVLRLHLTNFLSYRKATLELGDLTALVGPNASGKSNAVAAFRLLREIPTVGLPTAIARRGGFDQLRHRSEGRPYDPGLRVEFQATSGDEESSYELQLGAVQGKRYEVKLERGEVVTAGRHLRFRQALGRIELEGLSDETDSMRSQPRRLPSVQPDQSALPVVYGVRAERIWLLLNGLQTVEVNPAKVKELQDPGSRQDLEPDGSNSASCFEALSAAKRSQLVDELSAIVPGIERIEPLHVADKMTLTFFQRVADRSRKFSAKQMSDGTLRAFGILLSLYSLRQSRRPSLVVIEEPETAIHLGALRTLVEILRAHSHRSQILLTTHSADIVDSLSLDELRVVWSEEGASHIAPVAEHTRGPIQRGLITPGELLRSDALDPAAV